MLDRLGWPGGLNGFDFIEGTGSERIIRVYHTAYQDGSVYPRGEAYDYDVNEHHGESEQAQKFLHIILIIFLLGWSSVVCPRHVLSTYISPSGSHAQDARGATTGSSDYRQALGPLFLSTFLKHCGTILHSISPLA